MNKKKLLSVVLSLALVFSMTSAFGVSAYADTSDSGYVAKAPNIVKVAGIQLTDGQYINANNLTDGAKYGTPYLLNSYAYYKDGKLILHNFVLTGFNDSAAITVAEKDSANPNALNIVLEGKNKIFMGDKNSAIDAGYLDLVISANTKGASLNLESKDGDYPESSAIGTPIDVDDNADGDDPEETVAESNNTIPQPTPVDCISAGSFELLSGTVTITAGTGFKDISYLPYYYDTFLSYFDTAINTISGDAVISGGELNINKAAVGIIAYMVSVNGGKVNIGSEDNSITHFGIFADKLLVNGGSLSINNVGYKTPSQNVDNSPTNLLELLSDEVPKSSADLAKRNFAKETHEFYSQTQLMQLAGVDENDYQPIANASQITYNRNCDGVLVYDSVIMKGGVVSIDKIQDYGIETVCGDFMLYDGKLSITKTGEDGIYVSSGESGEDESSLNMSGGSISMSDTCWGIYVEGDANISNAVIDIKNTEIDGIAASNCSIENSTVTINDSEWDGIWCSDKLLDISKSTIKLNGIEGCGFDVCDGKVVITDSFIIVDSNSDGIYSSSGVEVKNSDIEAQTTSTYKNYHAFYPSVKVFGNPVVYAGSTPDNAKRITDLNKLYGYQYVHICNDSYIEPVKKSAILFRILQDTLKLNNRFSFFKFNSWGILFNRLFL